jgi:hypothetical protein
MGPFWFTEVYRDEWVAAETDHTALNKLSKTSLSANIHWSLRRVFVHLPGRNSQFKGLFLVVVQLLHGRCKNDPARINLNLRSKDLVADNDRDLLIIAIFDVFGS